MKNILGTYQKWGDRHGQLLHSLLVRYNRCNIKYFILRNYEGLPEENNSKDVDLIIKPGSYSKAKDILLDVFREEGIEYFYVVQYDNVRCCYGIDFTNKFSIHIDLIEGYLHKGIEIFSFEYLYEGTLPYKNYRVLSDAYDAVMLVLYKVIGCKELKQKYIERITKNYPINKEKIQELLSFALGNKLGKEICFHIENDDYGWLTEHTKTLSYSSKKLAFKRHPIKWLVGGARFWCEKIYRIMLRPKKYRKFIAVEAPDGTGKTTAIDGVSNSIINLLYSVSERIHIYHFRPNIFPNLGAAGEKIGVMKQDTNFEVPHRKPPAPPVQSFFRMMYYWMDYVIGIFFCIRKDVQFDTFSIFDRYIYDFLIDPERSRIRLPRWIRVAFVNTAPQPDLVLILEAQAETIYRRKKELELPEIQRQLAEFHLLESRGPNYVTIDANRSPEDVIDQMVRAILDRYMVRVRENEHSD